MADKKISQFPTFDGTADSEVFFVVGSGEADNPNASNYRYPFNNLTTDITKEGSAWTTGTDLIYTLTGAVGLGTSAPIYQLDVANTGRFRSDLIVSGDMYVSGTTHINKIIDASITGTISGVTGEFADGIFADSLTISGTPVSTGGSIEVPGGGGSIIGGDVSNINFGGTEASDTRAVNFQVGGVDKLVIGSDGNVSISEDLTVSGNVSGAIISGRSGVFSHSLTVSGQPVLTGTSSSLGKWTDGAGGDIYYNGGDVGIGTDTPTTALDTHGTISLNSSGVSRRGLWFGSGTQALGYIGPQDYAVNDLTTGDFGISSAKSDHVFTGSLAFGIGGAEKMRILSDGKVGIGTPLPEAPLDIVGPDGPLTTANDGIVIRAAATNDWLTMGTDSSTRTSWIRAVRSTVGENDLSLQGDGGKVGIGTAAPKGPLEVLSGAAGHVDQLFLTNNNGADDDSAGIVFSQAPATHHYAGIRGIFTDVTAATEDAELAFYTSDTGTYAEKVRIDNNGNVGIGTTSPTHDLTIGDGTDSSWIKLDGVDGSFQIGASSITGPEKYFSIYDTEATAHRFVISESGEVGVGVTSANPGATLEVQAHDDSTDAYAFWVVSKDHTNSIIIGFENGDVQIGELFYDDTISGVGIGTLTPQAPLDVVSTVGGVVMPRMTTAQMNAIVSPSNGEMIYNTNSGVFAGHAAGAWVPLH